MLKVAALLILLFIPLLASAQTIEKKVNIPPLRENANRYFYVPFEVPAGAKSFSVSYEYDRKNRCERLGFGCFRFLRFEISIR